MTKFELPDGRPAIMGVLNVTPDSFSDGGHHFSRTAAIERGLQMVAEGADIIDIGGESTRPGSEGVSVAEELERVLAVVHELVSKGIVVSIDTSKFEVAKVCLEAGASIVNDVTALQDSKMREVCGDAKCIVCLMHMQGEPRTMQKAPTYRDVVKEVATFLTLQASEAIDVGVPQENIWIDPGIGFGKTLEHNLELLRNLDELVTTGYPVVVGVSRKSFIGKVLDGAPVDDRLEGTLAAQVLAQAMGAKVIRTHDVKAAKRALTMTEAILG